MKYQRLTSLMVALVSIWFVLVTVLFVAYSGNSGFSGIIQTNSGNLILPPVNGY